MYVVIVDFEVAPEDQDKFLPLIEENARSSATDEPGCLQFDVCVDPERPGSIFLYEVYRDRAAFDAHTASPHYAKFDAASRDMVRGKAVRLLERTCP